MGVVVNELENLNFAFSSCLSTALMRSTLMRSSTGLIDSRWGMGAEIWRVSVKTMSVWEKQNNRSITSIHWTFWRNTKKNNEPGDDPIDIIVVLGRRWAYSWERRSSGPWRVVLDGLPLHSPWMSVPRPASHWRPELRQWKASRRVGKIQDCRWVNPKITSNCNIWLL